MACPTAGGASASPSRLQDGLLAHVMHPGYHGFGLFCGLVKRSTCCPLSPCTVLGCAQAGAHRPRREALRLPQSHRPLAT